MSDRPQTPEGGETTKETLTRVTLHYGPDGQAVARSEAVEVEVTWPNGRPTSKDEGYTRHGSWCLAEPNEGADHA